MRRFSLVPSLAGIVMLAACSGGSVSPGSQPAAEPSSPDAVPAKTTAAAEPQTEAGVRAAATRFYALYSAGQWAQSWEDLAPASQAKVPEALWTDAHDLCEPPANGMARVIKGITMAGSTAIVQETVSGALGKLGTVSDVWTYADGRWGMNLTKDDYALYGKGSAKAVAAAARAEGDCATPAP